MEKIQYGTLKILVMIILISCGNENERRGKDVINSKIKHFDLPLPIDSYKIIGNINNSTKEVISPEIEFYREAIIEGDWTIYPRLIRILSQKKMEKDAFQISKLVADRDTLRAACKQVFFDLTNFGNQNSENRLPDSVRRQGFYYLFLTLERNKDKVDYESIAILKSAFGNNYQKYKAKQILLDTSIKIPEIPRSVDLYNN